MATYRIYSLSDPRDGLARYVGRTKNSAEHRMRQHWGVGRKHSSLGEWFSSLKDAGLRPAVTVLQEHDHPFAEWYWTSRLKEEGHPIICNVLIDKFPKATIEEAVASGVKSRQRRWNERHKSLMAEVQARYRKSSEHYKRKHAGYQRTYMAKVRSNPQHPIEPDPWLS